MVGLSVSSSVVGDAKLETFSPTVPVRKSALEWFPDAVEKRRVSMDPMLRPFRDWLRRRLAFMTNLFRKLRVILMPQAPEVRLQRICPFCGLITLRHKTSCLECGRSFKPV